MKNKIDVIEALKTTPIIQVACQKAGIGRATYYRWRTEDLDFKQKTDKSIKSGTHFINDLAESQLLSAIKDKNMTAIIYWLNNHHSAYSNNKFYLSDKEKEKMIRSIFSPNSENAIKLVAKKTIKGKIPNSFFNIFRSIINSLNQIKGHEIENKKVEILTKLSGSKNNYESKSNSENH